MRTKTGAALLVGQCEVEYRVNNPKDWYDKLASDASAFTALFSQDEQAVVPQGSLYDPVPDLYVPQHTTYAKRQVTKTAPSAFRIADSSGLPIRGETSVKILLNETIENTRVPAFIELDGEVSSTTTIRDSGEITFDLSNALDSVVALSAALKRRSAYGYGFTAIYTGFLRPLVKGKWGVKATYQFTHDTVPTDTFDGCSIRLSFRTYGFRVTQLLTDLSSANIFELAKEIPTTSVCFSGSTPSSSGDEEEWAKVGPRDFDE